MLQYRYYRDIFPFLGSSPYASPCIYSSTPPSNFEAPLPPSPRMFLTLVGNPALFTGLVSPPVEIVHAPNNKLNYLVSNIRLTKTLHLWRKCFKQIVVNINTTFWKLTVHNVILNRLNKVNHKLLSSSVFQPLK